MAVSRIYTLSKGNPKEENRHMEIIQYSSFLYKSICYISSVSIRIQTTPQRIPSIQILSSTEKLYLSSGILLNVHVWVLPVSARKARDTFFTQDGKTTSAGDETSFLFFWLLLLGLVETYRVSMMMIPSRPFV